MYASRKKIILASGSPRRQSYLKDMGIEFDIVKADVDEAVKPSEPPLAYVSRISKEKAVSVMENHPERWVLAADTIVYVGDVILGKPKDREDALKSLLILRGKSHYVATSFSLGCRDKNNLHEETVITEVTFGEFDEKTAQKYVDTGEPDDKAGSYGIQGLGASLVSGVKGSYSNVVGLPLWEVLVVLKRHNIVASD